MPASEFERVVELARALSRAEQWRMRAILETWLRFPQTPITEEEFKQELVHQGIVSAPPPVTEAASHQRWKPIKIKGRPLSETLIEERR